MKIFIKSFILIVFIFFIFEANRSLCLDFLEDLLCCYKPLAITQEMFSSKKKKAKIQLKKLSKKFFTAVDQNSIEEVKEILDKNQNLVNTIDESNRTALWISCQQNYVALAELLIARGAKINYYANGANPLAFACANKNTKLANLLIQFGAKAEIIGPEGIVINPTKTYLKNEEKRLKQRQKDLKEKNQKFTELKKIIEQLEQ